MERLFLMNKECNAAPIARNFSSFDVDFQKHDLISASDQLQSCFSCADWENSVELYDPLESALSSIVSSPATSNVSASLNSVGDKLIVRELIGRLGSEIGDIPAPPEYLGGKKDNADPSYYSTPLNSPPKLNLSVEIPDGKGHSSFFDSNVPIPPSLKPFSSDLEFATRAALFSSLAARNGGLSKDIPMIRDIESQIAVQENRKSSIQCRTSLSKKSRKLSRSLGHENAEIGDSREGSSLSEQISCSQSAMKEKDEVDLNDRKRKLISNVNSEEKPSPSSAKIAKIEGRNDRPNIGETSARKNDGTKTKTETNEGKKSEEDENQKRTKLPEAPKDYIHVRARRGEATDSHSLAERVRREKISERMKFLQDLVPGCNKVTGKAVMLDEIINYVQSLQRQVEFLSMKLASVPPTMNLNMEALLSKDIIQSCVSLQHIISPLDSSSTAFKIGCHSVPFETEITYPEKSLNAFLCRNPDIQTIHLDEYCKDDDQQVLSCWEDDLQSVVQMGFGQNQQQNSSS